MVKRTLLPKKKPDRALKWVWEGQKGVVVRKRPPRTDPRGRFYRSPGAIVVRGKLTVAKVEED